MDYVYMDESGDLANQTKYFVMSSIRVHNPKRLASLIKRSRRDYKKYLSNYSEIKGHKTNNQVIKKILMRINKIDSEISVIFLNKENVYKIPHFYKYNVLYDTLASELAGEIPIENPTNFFIDKSKNKQKEITDFNVRFSANLNNPKNYPIKINHVNSMSYPGVQVADLISWSVFQSLEHKNGEFIDLIENKNIKEVFKY